MSFAPGYFIPAAASERVFTSQMATIFSEASALASSAPRPAAPSTAMFNLPLRFAPRRIAGAASEPAAAARADLVKCRRVIARLGWIALLIALASFRADIFEV